MRAPPELLRKLGLPPDPKGWEYESYSVLTYRELAARLRTAYRRAKDSPDETVEDAAAISEHGGLLHKAERRLGRKGARRSQQALVLQRTVQRLTDGHARAR